MDIMVGTYGTYLALSIGLTVWVASTLSRNGQVFLIDVFSGNKELAQSINHLLVVGFYLINLGFVSLALKLGYDVFTIRQAIESLSGKMGLVLLVLGAMHFFNILVFQWIRSASCHQTDSEPPIAPDGFTEFGVHKNA